MFNNYFFLFCFQSNADVIYLTDAPGYLVNSSIFVDLQSLDGYQSFVVQNPTYTWISVEQHFGCTFSKASSIQYSICTHNTPGLFTLAHIKSDGQTCDHTAPPITLQKHTLTDISLASGSVITRDAFWAVPFYLSDDSVSSAEVGAWSLAVQYLLHLIHRPVMIYNITTDPRHVLSKSKTLIIDVLRRTNCSSITFRQCIQSVISSLYSDNYISVTFQAQLFTYLEGLDRIYTFPEVIPRDSYSHLTCQVNDVIYSPVSMELTYNKIPSLSIPNLKLSVDLVENVCHFYTLPNKIKVDLSHPWIQQRDLVLIVVFNNPHYEVIPYIEVLYRSFFPHVVYCGPGYPNQPALKRYNLTFVSYGANPEGFDAGSFSYICPSMVMSMHYKTKGYLVIADDIILSVFGIQNFPLQSIWFLPKAEIRIADIKTFRECRLGMCDFFPHWHWWLDYKDQTVAAYHELYRKRSMSPFFHKCYSTLSEFCGGERRVCGGYSDIFYIPNVHTLGFRQLVKLFYDHHVFSEITLPTLIQCLETSENIHPLHGHVEWSANRDFPWLYFTQHKLFEKVFLHPVKWSYMMEGSSDHTQFFCTKVLPFMFDKFGRLS